MVAATILSLNDYAFWCYSCVMSKSLNIHIEYGED